MLSKNVKRFVPTLVILLFLFSLISMNVFAGDNDYGHWVTQTDDEGREIQIFVYNNTETDIEVLDNKPLDDTKEENEFQKIQMLSSEERVEQVNPVVLQSAKQDSGRINLALIIIFTMIVLSFFGYFMYKAV